MNNILIIDDDKQVRLGLRWVLEREGYKVLDAYDGKRGIEVIKNHPVDLVVTDIIMPEKEGVETISEIKKFRPDLKILAISGGGSIDPRVYLHVACKVGASRTLAKPFAREEFISVIQELMD